MTSVLVGYFPKRSARPADWKAADGVSELCNVSSCIAKAPDGWIDRWRHNEIGFFDDPKTAQSLIPAGEKSFSIFAYRLFSQKFEGGVALPFEIGPVSPEPLPPSYRSLGFDVVSKSISSYFECSPLSCNNLAEEVAVNRYCLLGSTDEAVTLAARLSLGGAEPGPYYIVEVLREQPAA